MIASKIYGLWAQVPASVRASLSIFVMAVVAAGLAYGWHWPTDWLDAREQVATFWLFLVPVAYATFRKAVWPPLFAWMLGLAGLSPTIDAKALVPAWKPEK